MQKLSNSRQSGIELLKIIAIFLIVISHVIYTLRSSNPYIDYQDYVLDLSLASRSVQMIILQLMRSFGIWGNNIFFICSAWFLLDSQKFSKKKWMFLFAEIWIVSISITIVFLLTRKGIVAIRPLLESIFPVTVNTYWYLTCYLFFLPLYPFLNHIIYTLEKKTLFRIALALFFVYFVLGFIGDGLFFASRLILWVTIYFIIAFIKLYMKDLSNKISLNLLILFGFFLFWFLFHIVLNIIGLHIELISDKMMWFSTVQDPFLFVMAIALFNIFRNLVFYNKIINFISSLSMLVYIIHEQPLLRTYIRPFLVNFIYEKYGYSHLILFILLLSCGVFAFSILISLFYKFLVEKAIHYVVDRLYDKLRDYWRNIEKKVLEKIH